MTIPSLSCMSARAICYFFNGILKKLFHFLQETVGGVAGIFSMRASDRGLPTAGFLVNINGPIFDTTFYLFLRNWGEIV